MRKHLGIFAFFFASIHAFQGATSKASLNSDSDWMDYTNVTLGILFYAAFTVVAVSTSPGVADSMSWAEFRAVFSWMGLVVLIIGVLNQGFPGWINYRHSHSPEFWVGKGAVMPSYWLGFMIPLVAIVMRLVTWSPCAVIALCKL